MRAALIAIMVLLLPAALLASQTMGIWFDYRAGMVYDPAPHESFVGYVYADNAGCYLNAVEFGVSPLPAGIFYDGFVVPEGSLVIGDPVQGVLGVVGVSITYFPPLNGYFPGYNELCKLYFTAEEDWCVPTGTIVDFPLAIVPHAETGLIQGSCFPEGNLINFTGVTSVFCPCQIGVKTTSWGAIKNLF
jgi:hypothetical protein